MLTTPAPLEQDHPAPSSTTALPVRRGPGALAEPGAPSEWGGRRVATFTRRVLEVYGVRCWICGLPGADSVDHVIPRSLGGAVWDIENAAPAHRRCNYARGNRAIDDPALLVESGASFFSD